MGKVIHCNICLRGIKEEELKTHQQVEMQSEYTARILQAISMRFSLFSSSSDGEALAFEDGIFLFNLVFPNPKEVARVSRSIYPDGIFQNPHILSFPKIGEIDICMLLNEYKSIIYESMRHNSKKTANLMKIYLQKIWKSELFEKNPDLDMYLKIKNKIKTAGTSISSRASQIVDLNKEYYDEVHGSKFKFKKEASEIHENISDIFEVYRYFVGIIRGFLDIVSEKSEKSNILYFNKNVCYGVDFYRKKWINKQPVKIKESKYGTNTIINRIKDNCPQLTKFIKDILCQDLRKIRNSKGHRKLITQQKSIDSFLYIIDNPKEKYLKEFSYPELMEIWIVLYYILVMSFSIYFYIIPVDSINNAIGYLLHPRDYEAGLFEEIVK